MITLKSKEAPFDVNFITESKIICSGAPLETYPLIQRIAKAFILNGLSVVVISTSNITLDSVRFKCQYTLDGISDYDIVIYYVPEKNFYFPFDFNINDVKVAFSVEHELSGYTGTQYVYSAQSAAGFSDAQIRLQQTDWLMLRDIEQALFGDKPTALFMYRESLREEASLNYESQKNNICSE
ncbi:TPA: hypothetical protein SIA39_004235 [Aeromonas sobria]|nr:hypothetical protein [Aeromonas sobria]